MTYRAGWVGSTHTQPRTHTRHPVPRTERSFVSPSHTLSPAPPSRPQVPRRRRRRPAQPTCRAQAHTHNHAHTHHTQFRELNEAARPGAPPGCSAQSAGSENRPELPTRPSAAAVSCMHRAASQTPRLASSQDAADSRSALHRFSRSGCIDSRPQPRASAGVRPLPPGAAESPSGTPSGALTRRGWTRRGDGGAWDS